MKKIVFILVLLLVLLPNAVFSLSISSKDADLRGFGSIIETDYMNVQIQNSSTATGVTLGGSNTPPVGSFDVGNDVFTLSGLSEHNLFLGHHFPDRWIPDGDYRKRRRLSNGSVNPVPEPATILLIGVGLACIVGINRKKTDKI